MRGIDAYSFYPDIATRFAQFRKPGLYQVGMTGACVLISKPVLEARVNYDHIYNVSFWERIGHLYRARTWL